MKWTETVLLARRRSDGAFFRDDSMHGPSWEDSPIGASKLLNLVPLQNLGYDIRSLEPVELTITYEVDDP